MPVEVGSLALVLGSVAPVFALIALGYFCGRERLLGTNAFDVLNRFVLRFALPALTFHILSGTAPDDLVQPAMILAIVRGSAVIYAASLGLDRLSRRLVSDLISARVRSSSPPWVRFSRFRSLSC